MKALSHDEARRLIDGLLASLLDPDKEPEALSCFVSPRYVQDVDGVRLDYQGFLDHARIVKTSIRRASATIQRIAVDGATIADIHVVEAEKTNGERLVAKVIAFFTVEDGRIVAVDELTHILHGSDADRDLGSRGGLDKAAPGH